MSISEYAISSVYGYGVLIYSGWSTLYPSFNPSLIVRASSGITTPTETRVSGILHPVCIEDKAWPLFLVFDDADMLWKEYFTGMPVDRVPEPSDKPSYSNQDLPVDPCYDVDSEAVTVSGHVCSVFPRLSAIANQTTAPEFSRNLSIYEGTGHVAEYVRELSRLRSEAEKWCADVQKAIRDVAEERRRKEEQSASTGQKIAAGFGQYSATSGFWQSPAAKEGEQGPGGNDMLYPELESVRRLLDARQWKEALDMLQPMNLANADINVCRVYADYMSKLFGMFPGIGASESVLDSYDKKVAYLSAKASPLYNKYRNALSEELKKFEESSSCFIQQVEKKPFLLNGYYTNRDSEFAFFTHGRKLMYLFDNKYYTVKSVKSGTITLLFDSYRIYQSALSFGGHRLRIVAADIDARHIVIRDSAIGEPNGIKTTRPYYRKDTEELTREYASIRRARSSPSICSCCGGAYSFWSGCSRRCHPHIPDWN